MTYFDADGIKRRREERVRKLREEMENTYSSYFFDEREELPPVYMEPVYREREEPWRYEEYRMRERPHRRTSPGLASSHGPLKRGDKLFIKVIASLFLLSLAYVISHLSFPGVEKYRTVMNEVMSRSYNFAGMSAWYEKNFGAIPTLLPTVGTMGNEAKPVLQSQSMLLPAPASGRVVQTFAEQGSGLYFTPKAAAIHAIDQGWVTFAGEKEGLGNTVIIQHAKGMETWYAGLASLDVKPNDWVEVQRSIGKAGVQGEVIKPVYFAVKKNEQFVDPQGVVRFE